MAVPCAERGRMAWRPFGPLRAQSEECSDVSLGNEQMRPIWVGVSVFIMARLPHAPSFFRGGAPHVGFLGRGRGQFH